MTKQKETTTFVSFIDENAIYVSVDKFDVVTRQLFKDHHFRTKGGELFELWIVDATHSMDKAKALQLLRDLGLPFSNQGKKSPSHVYRDYLKNNLVRGDYKEIAWIDADHFVITLKQEKEIRKRKKETHYFPPPKLVPFGDAGPTKKGWTVIHDESGKDFVMDPRGIIYPYGAQPLDFEAGHSL